MCIHKNAELAIKKTIACTLQDYLEEEKKDIFFQKQLGGRKSFCWELNDLSFCAGLAIFLTLSNSHEFSESQFPHLKNNDNNYTASHLPLLP